MEQYVSKMGLRELADEVTSIKATVKGLQISDLVEPDWEALEHERQHGGNISHMNRETEEDKSKRESILSSLQARADDLTRQLLQTQAE